MSPKADALPTELQMVLFHFLQAASISGHWGDCGLMALLRFSLTVLDGCVASLPEFMGVVLAASSLRVTSCLSIYVGVQAPERTAPVGGEGNFANDV